jgi:uncharacterized protein (TIGR02145 family)
MKLLSLLFSFSFVMASIQGQDFQISFAGSGSATTVDNVKIENLTKGTVITLNGTDILQLTPTTGINDLNPDVPARIKVYPNPVNSVCSVDFETNTHGKVSFGLYDIAGRLIAQSDEYLSQGHHLYKLSGFKSGIYILKIASDNFVYTSKLVSNNPTDGMVEIKHISTGSSSEKEFTKADAAKDINTKSSTSSIDFQYNTGDILKLTGTSGNYKTVAVTESPVTGVFTFMFTPCVDRDDNRYSVVFLGTQAWMAENLRTTKYDNGELIGTTPTPTYNISAMSTPKYQWAYAGTESNVAVYGRLYTWHVAADSRLLCPTGWRVPTDADWTILTDHLGGLTLSGSKLKETGTTHWIEPNYGANNKSGFTALPGGYRHQDGTFASMAFSAYFWTSESATTTYGWSRYLQDGSQATTRYGIQTKQLGLSVRCVKE